MPRNARSSRKYSTRDSGIRSLQETSARDFRATSKAAVVSELQPEVKRLLEKGPSLSEATMDLLAESEVLYKGLCPAPVMVFQKHGIRSQLAISGRRMSWCIGAATTGFGRSSLSLDWKRSGFYPEYWERVCVKMANNFSWMDHFDRYKYLPSCVSPNRWPIHWLVDRVWDCSMMNV